MFVEIVCLSATISLRLLVDDGYVSPVSEPQDQKYIKFPINNIEAKEKTTMHIQSTDRAMAQACVLPTFFFGQQAFRVFMRITAVQQTNTGYSPDRSPRRSRTHINPVPRRGLQQGL